MFVSFVAILTLFIFLLFRKISILFTSILTLFVFFFFRKILTPFTSLFIKAFFALLYYVNVMYGLETKQVLKNSAMIVPLEYVLNTTVILGNTKKYCKPKTISINFRKRFINTYKVNFLLVFSACDISALKTFR